MPDLYRWLASARAKVEAATTKPYRPIPANAYDDLLAFAIKDLPALLDVAEAAGVLSDDVAEMSSCSCPRCANVRVLRAALARLAKGGE